MTNSKSIKKTSATENICLRLNDAAKSLGLNKSELAVRMGFSQGMVSEVLNGKQPPSDKFLRLFSSVFHFPMEWLVHGQGSPMFDAIPMPSRMIPVVSMANAGREPGVIWEDAYPVGQGFKMVNCPYDLTDSKAYALEVRGSSMSPRYDEGEIVFVAPSKQVNNGSYAVVKLRNGEVMVKRVRFKDHLAILESVNPAYESVVLDRDEIEFFHKVTHKKEKS